MAKQEPKSKTKTAQLNLPKKDTFDSINNWIEPKKRFLQYFFVGITILFSVLLFDIKLSTGGDDGDYIMRALNFYKKFQLPTFQGPLYPVILSFFIRIWGIKVPLLKALSVLFMALHTFFMFKALNKRIPNIVLVATLIFISLNVTLLFYASQTYTEAFYLMLLSATIWAILVFFDKIYDGESDKKKFIKYYLLIGFLIFCNVITKNIAIVILPAILGYLLLKKQFLHMILIVASTFLFIIPFEITKRAVWPQESIQIGKQGKILMYKDPYDYSKGEEDLGGFVDRFFGNVDIYVSKHIPHMWGLKSMKDMEMSKSTGFFILFILLGATLLALNKNRAILFIGILTLVSFVAIFVALQTRWDSDRLILVYVPIATVVVLYGFYRLFQFEVVKMLQPIYLILLVVLSLVQITKTSEAASKNYKVLKKNFGGNKYYGYTEDWQNFIKMSEYCANTLPNTVKVLSRKPSMSTIYGNGKEFPGIFKVPSNDADTCLDYLRKCGATYVIHASLRQNPMVNNGQVITTTGNLLYFIMQKYPQRVKQIHQIGEVEPAYLFQVDTK